MAGNDVPSDAVQPSGGGPALGAISVTALDRRYEHVGGQVGRVLRARDPSSDEPLHQLDVGSVERADGTVSVTSKPAPDRFIAGLCEVSAAPG
jgi:hypothetical protein